MIMSNAEAPKLVETPQNEATAASDKFLQKEKHGFIRTMGTILRTGSTEFLTFLGGVMAPVGVAFTTLGLLGNRFQSQLDPAFDYAQRNDPAFQLQLNQFKSQWLQEHGTAITDAQIKQELHQGLGMATDFGKQVGVGTTIAGGLAAGIGTAIGWQGAKHTESSRKWYIAGKVAEFGTIAASLFVPGMWVAYPFAKAFSIGATFYSQTKRPN